MKIDQTSLAFIQKVVDTASLVKIDNIIIEPGKVRAIDEDRTVVIFHDQKIPDMPFGSIGLNRIGVFSNRYDLARSIDGFDMEAVVESSNPQNVFCRALVMKAKSVKIDYRCANPLTIQAPKTLNDAAKYRIAMTPQAVSMMKRGQTAMSSDEIKFIGGPDGVLLEMSDVNSDALTFKFADKIEVLDDEGTEPNFQHKYPIKTLLPLFSADPDVRFCITGRGMIKIVVNNLDVYVVPRA
jgi:hypothetical protein